MGLDDSHISYFNTIGMSDRKIVGHYSRFQKISLNDDMPVASYEIDGIVFMTASGISFGVRGRRIFRIIALGQILVVLFTGCPKVRPI